MKRLLVFASLLLSNPVHASPCDQFFPNGKEIAVPGTQVICRSFYATVYDTKHEANVFSTEIDHPKGKKAPRVSSFHSDPAVVNSPTPEDYTNTGFDRGHMTPAADSYSAIQSYDTFFMTNITPQYPNVNRIAWKNLESSVRDMSFNYVVTGAYYANYNTVIGKHKVPVPTSIYKIVYLKDGSIKAFEADNVKKNKQAKPVDIAVIEKQTGIKFH